MVALCPLFEGLDLLDLWHLYGHAKQASNHRNVAISTVSRRAWELVVSLGAGAPQGRGAPDPQAPQTASILFLRQAYQQWRLERGCLKVLPTFATSVAVRELKPSLDVLPDVYLSAEALAEHLQLRRVDLVLSSSLDLAGELMREAQADPASPFAVVPLFSDEVRLAVNPTHPLAGMEVAAPEDCRAFPSAGYPDGVARIAAELFRERGLWRFACKRNSFDPSEWLLGMRSKTGLCYETLFLSELMPESRELVVMPFAQPVFQTNAVVLLKELLGQPELEAVIERIRASVFRFLAGSNHAFTRC